MQKLRLLALTSVFAAFGLMTACDTTSSNSGAPTIDKFSIANFDYAQNTWATGDSLEFWGEATDDNSIVEIKVELLNASNDAVATYTKVTSSDDLSFGKAGSNDYSLTTSGYIKNPGTWAAGSYTAKLTVKDNDGLTATKTITLAKVGGTSAVTTPLAPQGTLSVGGFLTAAPSFIGLGTNPAVAYKGSETEANVSKIDLVVTSDDAGTGTIFESTAYGVSTDNLTSSYWGSGRATLIAKVSAAPANLEAAKAVSLTAQTAVVVEGGIYVVKTVDNVYAVLTASNVKDYADAVTLSVSVLK